MCRTTGHRLPCEQLLHFSAMPSRSMPLFVHFRPLLLAHAESDACPAGRMTRTEASFAIRETYSASPALLQTYALPRQPVLCPQAIAITHCTCDIYIVYPVIPSALAGGPSGPRCPRSRAPQEYTIICYTIIYYTTLFTIHYSMI